MGTTTMMVTMSGARWEEKEDEEEEICLTNLWRRLRRECRSRRGGCVLTFSRLMIISAGLEVDDCLPQPNNLLNSSASSSSPTASPS